MTASKEAAQQLAKWFEVVRQKLDGTLFAVAPQGPHRETAIYELLSHHARLLRGAPVDQEGGLYNSLVLELAAACRVLGVTLGPDRWGAAVANVRDVKKPISESADDLGALGLTIGTRAQVFKQLFDQALADAGVAGVPTILNEESRHLALGVSVNWGMRLLLAHALECHPHVAPGARHEMDLAWIAGQVQSAG